MLGAYRYKWSLFVDWCAAADGEQLPLSTRELAELLADSPAGDTVQLRRVSAINRAHFRRRPFRTRTGHLAAPRLGDRAKRQHNPKCRALPVDSSGLPTTGSTAELVRTPFSCCWLGQHCPTTLLPNSIAATSPSTAGVSGSVAATESVSIPTTPGPTIVATGAVSAHPVRASGDWRPADSARDVENERPRGLPMLRERLEES